MSENHFIIGLGGTGGKIIRAFKKILYQEFHDSPPNNIRVQYLYVDSSKEMMAHDDPSWKHLGVNLQLTPSQQLLIQGVDLKEQLENINSYPGIRSWIGDRNVWRDILGSIVGETLGGQKRRLGRFLFANKINDFRNQIITLANDLRVGGNTAITFHICSGLAGGTGSGCLIDVLCHIREIFPEPRNYIILVYALLPETHPNPNWNTGNYFANGYAALLELNSLSVGHFKPFDITGNKERMNVTDPFNGCYVFINENENGVILNVDKDIPNLVADFLFLKIFGKGRVSWDSLRRMENAENGDGTPETLPGSNTPARSKRFLAFGIKRLIFPEEEIIEYLTFNFAKQAINQILYNNWSDTIGFTNEPKNQDFHSMVKQKEILQRWKLTDEHLTLSLPILPDEGLKSFFSIQQEWYDTINRYKLDVKNKSSKNWLDELHKLCQQRFEKQFRNMGVSDYYNTKRLVKKEYAREIRKTIETEIFDKFNNRDLSIVDASRLIEVLNKELESRSIKIDKDAVNSREKENNLSLELDKIKLEWGKLNIITSPFKKDKLFEEFAIKIQEYYINKTLAIAYEFAKELLLELRTEINLLQNEINKTCSLLFEADKRINELILSKCKEEEKIDLRSPIIKFYDPKVVIEFTNYMLRDKEIQFAQTTNLRNQLLLKLGETKTFAQFNNKFNIITFIDFLENQLEQAAIDAHNKFLTKYKEFNPILKINIIEKLQKEYASNIDELKKYITEISNYAGKFIQFDSGEINKKAPGIPEGVPTAISQYTVIMPDAKESSEFAKSLKDIFKGSIKGNVEILEGSSKSNEIALVSICNLFPLRYIKHLKFLKDKYEKRINELSPQRAYHELHIEGTTEHYLPLFTPTPTEIVNTSLPYIIIAIALKQIQLPNDPSMRQEIKMIVKDEYGIEEMVKIANSIEDLPDELTKDLNKLENLKSYIIKSLSENTNKKTELIEQIKSFIDYVKNYVKGNIEHSLYINYSNAAKQAIRLVNHSAF